MSTDLPAIDILSPKFPIGVMMWTNSDLAGRCVSPKPSPGSEAAGSGASSARKNVQWTVFSEMGPAGPWEVDFDENACVFAERRMRSFSKKKGRKPSIPQGDRPLPTRPYGRPTFP